MYMHVIEMGDRGFRLVSEDLTRAAFIILEQSGCPYPFHDGMAGRGWLEAFKRRHPKISLSILHELSHILESLLQVRM